MKSVKVITKYLVKAKRACMNLNFSVLSVNRRFYTMKKILLDILLLMGMGIALLCIG